MFGLGNWKTENGGQAQSVDGNALNVAEATTTNGRIVAGRAYLIFFSMV